MRGWIQWVVIVLATTAMANVTRAGQDLPSNLGILERLTEQAVSEVVSSLSPPRGQAVTLLSSSPHEGNQFILGRLALALAEEGYEVTIAWAAVTAPLSDAEEDGDDDDDDAPTEKDGVTGAESLAQGFSADAYPEGTILDLDVLQFGVHYAEAKRRMWVGGVEFTRIAGVYIRVSQLEGPSGRWIDMAKAEKHHWDRVSGRQRVLAEGAEYPFRSPTLHAPGLGTYVEPALVVGVVGSLIYLFYANQN